MQGAHGLPIGLGRAGGWLGGGSPAAQLGDGAACMQVVFAAGYCNTSLSLPLPAAVSPHSRPTAHPCLRYPLHPTARADDPCTQLPALPPVHCPLPLPVPPSPAGPRQRASGACDGQFGGQRHERGGHAAPPHHRDRGPGALPLWTLSRAALAGGAGMEGRWRWRVRAQGSPPSHCQHL